MNRRDGVIFLKYEFLWKSNNKENYGGEVEIIRDCNTFLLRKVSGHETFRFPLASTNAIQRITDQMKKKIVVSRWIRTNYLSIDSSCKL